MRIAAASSDLLETDYPRDSDTLLYRLLGEEGFQRHCDKVLLMYRLITSVSIPLSAVLGLLGFTLQMQSATAFLPMLPGLLLHAVFTGLTLNVRTAWQICNSFEALFVLLQTCGLVGAGCWLTRVHYGEVFWATIGYYCLCTVYFDALPTNRRRTMALALGATFCMSSVTGALLSAVPTIVAPDPLSRSGSVFAYGPHVNFDVYDFLLNRIYTLLLFFIKNAFVRMRWPDTYIYITPRICSPPPV
jgi:hypothetical protein